jgi:very-short-patch-repair endonuclease
MPHRKVPRANRRFAKAMRVEMTDAELRLWRHLRKPGIEGLRFRRQTPLGPHIVDFFCPSHRLIIEVDGGQHGLDNKHAGDLGRDQWLVSRGYRVLRFWNHEVLTGLDDVLRAILAASEEPPPEIR